MSRESYVEVNKKGVQAHKRKNYKKAQRLFLEAAKLAEEEHKTIHEDVSRAYYNAARAF